MKGKVPHKLCLFAFILLFVSPSYSQSLLEKAGGIKTDFEIISETKKINVTAQAIIKRGLSDMYEHTTLGLAYGYGLQTFRLEFITTDEIKGINHRYYYEMVLKDTNSSPLLITKINNTDIKGLSNGKDLRVYSINLQNIPMIILDKTQIIELAIKKYSIW